MRNAEPVFVSACLTGEKCRYDGTTYSTPVARALVGHGQAVVFCPELAGDLGVPRPRAEIVGGDGRDVLDGRAQVLTVDGTDVTSAFVAAARAAVAVAQASGCRRALLKSRSPSCGFGVIFDGTFSGRIKPGIGVAAAALAEVGVDIESSD